METDASKPASAGQQNAQCKANNPLALALSALSAVHAGSLTATTTNEELSFVSCALTPTVENERSKPFEMPPCVFVGRLSTSDANDSYFGIVTRKPRRIPPLQLSPCTLQGILFSYQGLYRMALKCNCDVTTLENAISRCAEPQFQTALPKAFLPLCEKAPCPIVASAICESTALATCAIVLQEALESPTGDHALNGHDRTTLEFAKRIIRDSVKDGIPNKDLAEMLGISESKLAHLFKAAAGKTIQEYARSVRMERARDLLETTRLPMSSIAEQLGFARQGSFSEAFKAAFGTTPFEHRKNRMEL